MTDDQKETVENYIGILYSPAVGSDALGFAIDTVSDRVLLYLNETTIPDSLLRVIAQIVVRVYKLLVVDMNTAGADRSVSVASDNGQSVEYTTSPTRYMDSANDQELFTGFERLLAQYRRPNVITE